MKKTHFDKVFITNLPAFYKIRLFNEIAKAKKILVIYLGYADDGRNKDFYNEIPCFESYNIKASTKSEIINKFFEVFRSLSYDELILGGWDHIIMWFAAFVSSRKKNSLICESSIYESKTKGIKGLIKKLFTTRINRCYVPGQAQKRIFDELKFKGEIVQTKGVGIFNYISQPLFVPRKTVNKFIFVGRLIEVKNLKLLISTFNKLPNEELYIVGFGEQEKELKELANDNCHFLGAVSNKDLYRIYQSMDVFILPSISEAWGLVVEEALNNGLPVIVSDKVGCADDLVNNSNGLVFKYDSESSLIQAIEKMKDIDYYNQLRKNISKLDFGKIEREQVRCYLK